MPRPGQGDAEKGACGACAQIARRLFKRRIDLGKGIADGQHREIAAVAEMLVHLPVAGGNGDLGHVHFSGSKGSGKGHLRPVLAIPCTR